MKRHILAAALAAFGSAATPTLASSACGPWGNDEVRCIGNNGIGRHQELGLSARDYKIAVYGKASTSGRTYFNVHVWRSLCGFPGIKLDADRNDSVSPQPHGDVFTQQEHAPYLQCIEFFIRECKDAHGKKLSCPDVVLAGIEERP
ncbi:MAG TPA: hypothetical protein VL899_14120 [Alphaproteobacteria bacterium]|nr:hypothetical protein [Alphaproteobacteria bacterium]